ncbi:MAG: type II toxin-antitoxin system RelE/ParE family toxin [Rhodobacteraceae bacterium]|jgi:plasmid stabilization system protein ParE|nr:type II toxin-antitoxin system RelE/ParE family toxin [Paracoccaceae bacterium]
MRLVRHPLVEQDIRALAEHILTVSGDPAAALRRLDEIDALIAAILQNPDLGTRLDGALHGWRVRHGGQGRALSIVYRAQGDRLFVALVAFGGQDWLTRGAARGGFGG